MSHNTLDPSSVLDLVEDCALLHSGGEADVYKVSAAGKDYVLKWYKSGCSFDTTVLDAVAKSRNIGHYQLCEYGKRKGKSGDTPYLLYDFIDGISSDRVQNLPVPVAIYAMRRLASTLAELRKKQVSHGDLAPSNIVFAVAGSGDSKDLLPVVIDFGIVGPGALAYAAPERFQGQAPSEKSDLFSLGLLLYRWIAGTNLIAAKDFEEYAAASSSIDCSKVSEMLYVNGGFSAQELSALEPLWSGLLNANPEDRLEDFDELDELLEIALDKISGGQVSLVAQLQKFVIQLEQEKLGEIVPTPEKCDLPYEILPPSKKNGRGRIFVFAFFGLILLIVALWFAVGSKGTDIDATGAMLLKQSRSLEMDSVGATPAEDVLMDEILQDLPVPVSGN